VVDAAALAELEGAVRTALEVGDDRGLCVLGYGEITLVLGTPVESPRWAAKRLPTFVGQDQADAYAEQFHRYLELLADRGVAPLPSTLHTTAGEQASVVAYVVQPVLARASLAPEQLRTTPPDADHPILATICRSVVAVVDDRTGLDGQLSNWATDADGELVYLDVTTPMLFDELGQPELDLDLFLAAYPWLLRPPIRRFVAPGVIGAYRDPRHVLLDLSANLLKERLEPWLPAAVEAANRHVDPPLTLDEVHRYYRSDARLWEAMLRLRRADRWWQRNVRRRPYPFLLPGPVRR
jgi:hypothetical protein